MPGPGRMTEPGDLKAPISGGAIPYGALPSTRPSGDPLLFRNMFKDAPSSDGWGSMGEFFRTVGQGLSDPVGLHLPRAVLEARGATAAAKMNGDGQQPTLARHDLRRRHPDRRDTRHNRRVRGCEGGRPEISGETPERPLRALPPQPAGSKVGCSYRFAS